jgi:hypothetical protein
MHLVLPTEPLARTIAADSGGTAMPEGSRWAVEAEAMVIDLDHCAAALGRPLTERERRALRHEGVKTPGYHIARVAGRVFITRERGLRATGFNLPAPMLETLKRNARARHLSLTQCYIEMADYYLTTFGDADALGFAFAQGEEGEGSAATLDLLARPGVTPQRQLPFPRTLLPTRTAPFLDAWREQRKRLIE